MGNYSVFTKTILDEQQQFCLSMKQISYQIKIRIRMGRKIK